MATETKNKVKFGLNKVYWAKITGYDEVFRNTLHLYVCRVLSALALTQMAKQNRFTQTTVFIICATTTPVMREIWKSH
jgi:hypothetical protein